MAKPTKDAPEEQAQPTSGKPWPDSLILTVSELAALTPEQQQEFRSALGTCISDPISTNQ